MTTKTNDTNAVMAAVQDFYAASMGGALELSDTVLTRLDTAIDRDPASTAALDAWSTFKEQFDTGGVLAYLDLFDELDSRFIDVFLAVRAAAWLDGFACGRDPLLLVFQQEGQVER